MTKTVRLHDYRICRWLADGSIIVADSKKKFWHVEDGGGKKYVGCCDSEEEREMCTAGMERIAGTCGRGTEEDGG